jgi:glutathione S-transferase
MNLHLYYCPGTCSFVPHAMLGLVQEAYAQEFSSTLINLKNGEQQTPEYKAINPRSQVPALLVDGKLLTQVIAIVSYLDATFPKAQIFPTDPMERAQALSTLAWMNNTVHTTYTRVFRPERFSADTASVKSMALELFKSYLVEIDGLCKNNTPYICGKQLTPADIYAVAFVRWAGVAGVDPSAYPNYLAYARRMVEHPVIKKVMAKEEIVLDTYVK